MASQSKHIAVLTGDLIRSSDFSVDQTREVLTEIEAAWMAAGAWSGCRLIGKPDFFRGDSWQAALATPGQSLRVALFIRARLRALASTRKSLFPSLPDTRIALAIGPAQSVAENRISTSTGEAFTMSGAMLDNNGSGRETLQLAATAAAALETNLLGIIGAVCSRIANDWTARQAETIALWLNPAEPTLEAIANDLTGKASKQSVQKVLASGQRDIVEECLTTFEATYSDSASLRGR